MRLNIVQVGAEVLRQTARPLLPEEISFPETRQLIDWMIETMHEAPGVGLAAPQVGLPIQLAVIEDSQVLPERERAAVPLHVLINPRIVQRSEEQVEFFEGCLSLAGFSALVTRAHSVTVECLDEFGEPRRIEAAGWYARILQHEIDHLLGRLYIDHMEPRSFTTLENMTKRWKDVPIKAVREALGC
jgi:peptide deformylase